MARVVIRHYPHGVKTTHPYSKQGNAAYCYAIGHEPPHYPVPAIPVRVGWEPTGSGLCEGLPYWWIASPHLLWTCWPRYDILEERRP